MVDGFSVSWIKDAVLTWWSEGFQGKSTDEIRALLEEMVGLGVLRKTHEGHFALRSPNVVLLLGTEAEIEDQLVRSREAPPEYDPGTFRSALRNDLSMRSPLTVQQESALRMRENGVSIISGCPMAGLDELKDFLVSTVGQEFFFDIDNILEPAAFIKRLEDFDKRERQVDGTTIALVSATCPWSSKWVEIALKKVKQLKSKKSFVRVVFVADPQITWALVNQCTTEIDSLIDKGVTIFSLKPWDDAALRQWLEDCDFTAKDKNSRNKITEVTGNWSYLLQRFYQRANSDRRWENNLQEFAQLFSHSDSLCELFNLIGLDSYHSQQKQVLLNLATLASLGKVSSQDLISNTDSISAEIVTQSLKWAELLCLVYPVGNDNWHIDPLVNRILLSIGE